MTRTQKWVLALTSTAALMVALDQLVVSTALNSIRNDLHASIATLEWTANAYSLSFAVLLVTGAALGDRFGRRRMFVVGLAIFSLASVACALAPSIGILVAARAVQGAGSALVMPLAVALLTGAFPPEKRGGALGIFTALTGLAVVGGPLVGGAVTQGIAWQWIFWINVPIGAVLIPLVLLRTSESHGPRVRPDVLGLVLVSAGMFGLVWGLVRADAAGWGSAEVMTALVAGAVMTVVFVAWETRAREPMLSLGLFADRAYTGGNIAMFLHTGALFSSVFFLAQYLQITLGYSPLGAGLRFLPWTLPLFVIAPVAGRVLDRIGSRLLLTVGLVLQFIGLGWVALTIADGRSYTSAVAALVIAGCGASMAIPAGQNAVMNAVPREAIGKASGVYNTARQLGGAFGIAILAAVFAAKGDYSSPDAFRDGVGPALGVAAGMSALGAIAGALMRQRTTDVATAVPAPVAADAPAR
ncbi:MULTISPECIES: MFS transporter [unclassified Pseudofrankia]|uniref:MFS transporter n=1 Tax=unclassified Pseudofrankia TaxID=2994372 RepID=UPI0008DA6117|nr:MULTISPECIES: MFS transporter [unclassified Pseudofrankia]MDT3443632.1 MFS transporter [Pseudofrankia sp. BMG5.37]OHV60703.1 MFS transporter [Pseudofrankia sp. BMG5.36]